MGRSTYGVGRPIGAIMGSMNASPAARKCSHRVPVDRCPVHVRELAAAPAVVFDEEGRDALLALLDED